LLGIPDRVIARTELTEASSSVTISNIDTLVAALPFTARHLVVRVQVESTSGTPNLQTRFNGDTGGNYNQQHVTGASSSPSAYRTSGASAVSLFGNIVAGDSLYLSGGFVVPDAFSTRSHKSIIALAGEGERFVRCTAGRWASATAITSVEVFVDSSTMVAGSIVELAVVDEMYAIAGAEQILTADGTFTVEGLPKLSGDVVLIGNLRSDRASTNEEVDVEYNDDTTDGNYAEQHLSGSSTSASASTGSTKFTCQCPGDSADANAFGGWVHHISAFTDGVNDPSALTMGGYHGTSGASLFTVTSSRRNNIEALNKVKVLPGIGTNFLTNSMLSAYHVPKNVIAYKKLEEDSTGDVSLPIPSGYKHIKITGYARGTQASTGSQVNVEFNSDTTGGNYNWQRIRGITSSVSAGSLSSNPGIGNIPGANAGANQYGSFSVLVQNYTKTDRDKSYTSMLGGGDDDQVLISSHRYDSTDAIESVQFSTGGGAFFAAGSIFTVEGIGKDSIGWEDQGVARGGITGNGYKVEVDWANTGNMVALSDITADVTGLVWEHGRNIASQLTGRATAGKAVISLRNNSDQYNRNNSSSPYYGNILPGRKVRITDTTTGQIQFSGFMVNPATMVTMPTHKTARITAYGIISELARPDINIAKQSSITTGALVDAVLDQAGLTSSDHDIDTGQTTVTKYFKGDKQKALGAIREFEFTEAGFIRENHHLDGIVAFEDRHHRLKAPGQDSQATFGDSGTGGEFGFDQIQPNDDMSLIFNEFVARVELFTTQSIATLWTHSEANTSGTAPSIAPGESLVVWANYPNPATATEGRYVDAWTTPVATTDYTSNTQSNGGGTDRTSDTSIAVSKLSNAMKITLTNDHATDTIFITALKARGTAVFADDPAIVREEDTTSQTDYTNGMPKTWERRAEAKWVPSTDEALDWAQYHLGIYKDPSPTVVMGYKANKDHYHSHEASVRQVSDRISLDLTGSSGTGLDIDEDFYVEKVRHHVNLNGVHRVTYWLSSSAGYSDFWVVGESKLGTETRLAY
tara:strand:- start:6504 stop:9602 length:3099 start_codon:yes stop_codon:yes gene_type:complete